MPANRAVSIVATPKDLREIQNLGPSTREWIVDLERFFLPMWQRRIVACGITQAGRGFQFASVGRRGVSTVMACDGGQGRALVQGRRHAFGKGQAYLMPPDAPYAYDQSGRGPWHLAWVCYVHIEHQEPVLTSECASLVRVDPCPLASGIRGLHSELQGHGEPALLQHYLALVDAHARRIIGGSAMHGRLWNLWQQVDAEPGRRWTLPDLAGMSQMSAELLRQVCHRETGHSPLEHVTVLRMRRAASLLASREVKVQEVASAVGYRSPFAFSTAFKRQTGRSPAGYRAAAQQPAGPPDQMHPDVAFADDAERRRRPVGRRAGPGRINTPSDDR